ncbi:MAG TPA: hypothetical protein VMZ29_07265 [Candidatus Bathyarchaeia archaeon]|nr:hypothetical protein [Candidatus Bathyarchaeia archaeon]
MENEQKESESQRVRIIRDTTRRPLTEEQNASMKLLVMVIGLIVESMAFILLFFDEALGINLENSGFILSIFEIIFFVGGIIPFLIGFIPLVTSLRILSSSNRNIKESLKIIIGVLITLTLIVKFVELYYSIFYINFLHKPFHILIWPPPTLVKQRIFMSFILIANALVWGIIFSISKLIKKGFEVKEKESLYWSPYVLALIVITQVVMAMFYLLATSNLGVLDFVRPLLTSNLFYLTNVLFNVIMIFPIVNLEKYLQNTLVILEG